MGPVLADRALLVESHDLLAQTVTTALRGEGLEVERAPSGSAAEILHAADGGGHGLVVLDADRAGAPDNVAGTPDNVTELVAQLHARGLVVVVLTDSAEVAQSALDQGAWRVVRPHQGAASLRGALGLRTRRA